MRGSAGRSRRPRRRAAAARRARRRTSGATTPASCAAAEPRARPPLRPLVAGHRRAGPSTSRPRARRCSWPTTPASCPWDGAMMATARARARPARQPRSLVLDWAFSLPWVASVVRRSGGVPASPAQRPGPARGQGHAVVVFPEGAKGLGKPWRSRYRLERFGRGGFVELALRAGAPIVPCAVVGSEEIHPKLAELPLRRAPAPRAVLPGHADLPAARPAGARAAAVALAHRLRRAGRPRRPRARTRPTTGRWSSSWPRRCARGSRPWCTRTGPARRSVPLMARDVQVPPRSSARSWTASSA